MRLIRNANGSMTVEAALIMPIFLSFMMVLISMIQIARIEMALSNAAYETTKQITAHMYLVKLVAGEASTQIDNFLETPEVRDITDFITEVIPDDLLEIINKTIRREQDNVIKSVVKRLMISQFADTKVLNKDNIRVSSVELPDFSSSDISNKYFALEVEYKHTLPVPFFQRELTLKKRAREICWVGK